MNALVKVFVMHKIEEIDISLLPEDAQRQLFDFYLFLVQRNQQKQVEKMGGEPALLSESSLADWNNEAEDKAWQAFQ